MSNNFLFGSSTSAYQIEGCPYPKNGKDINEQEKGLCVWQKFTHDKKIDNGDIACDEFNRYDQTIEHLKELGVKAYRFSISWTRILPSGEKSKINNRGIKYYQDLIIKLKNANIEPIVTIYHWDHPEAFEYFGGWTSRKMIQLYLDYVRILFVHFGGYIKYWITINEPRVVAERGYGSSTMAPGRNKPEVIARVRHHLLLAHGHAVAIYRSLYFKGKIGISLNLKPVYCYDNNLKKVVYYQDITDKKTNLYYNKAHTIDDIKNNFYLDPLFNARYPGNKKFDFIHEGDMEIIAKPIDFIGVNNYSREIIAPDDIVKNEFGKSNAMGWEVYPRGLYDMIRNIYPRFHFPEIIVTENGYADKSEIINGKINDIDRINYIKENLEYVLKARKEGIPVNGYFVWSLMDNLEWSLGYKYRFGLIHVDFKTLVRTPKESYYWYKDFIKNH